MRIIHFSDSHAGGSAEDWMAYFDKRWVGIFNYHFRRRYQHTQALLSDAVEYILDVKPDIAVCTGDITSTGQPGEFQTAFDLLKPLVESDIPMIFIPGNHDYYVREKKCFDSMKIMYRTLNTYRRTEFEDLPLCKKIGECDFIIINESYPSNLFSSAGKLSKSTTDFVLNICKRKKERPRILIGHYPLHEKNPIMRFRHKLYGQEKVRDALHDGLIDLSLCGHNHRPEVRLNEKGRGEIVAGSVTRNNCIMQLDYDSDRDIFKYERINL